MNEKRTRGLERRILIAEDQTTPFDASGFLSARIWQFGGKTMGTSWTLKAVAEKGIARERIEEIAEAALALVVAKMSPWEDDSDLSRYRRAAAGSWVSFSKESFQVLSQSLDVSRLTDGPYDPSVGQVVDLLGFGPSEITQVDWAAIEKARSRIDGTQVLLDEEGKRVFQPGGYQLDLCSIAKGFAVDLIAEQLKEEGLNHFFIEVGGEVRGEGCKPDGQPWWCALQRPAGSETVLPETVAALCGCAVASSGNALRTRDWSGHEIGHLVSTRDAGLDKELLTVSVFHRSCMVADAFATALYLVGSKRGMELARRLELAVLLRKKGSAGFEEEWSPALARMMED